MKQMVLLGCVLLLSSCRNGPDIDPGIVAKNPDNPLEYEIDYSTGAIPISQAEGHICLRPEDVEEVLSHLQRRGFGHFKLGKGQLK